MDQNHPLKGHWCQEEQLTLTESSKLIEDTLVAEKKKMSQKVLEKAWFIGKERTVRKASDNTEEKGSFKSLRKKVAFFPFQAKSWAAADNMKSAWEPEPGNWETAKKF